MELIVDAEQIQHMAEKAANDISNNTEFAELLAEKLQHKRRKKTAVDSAVSSCRDTVAYLLRRELSGKHFTSLFSLLSEYINIIKRAMAITLEGVCGIEIRDDPMLERIGEKLREQISRIGEVDSFSRELGVGERAQVTLSNQLKRGLSLNRAIDITRKRLIHYGRTLEKQQLQQETNRELRRFITNGSLYKFQADKLERVLVRMYDGEQGENIIRDVQEALLGGRK